MNGKTVKLWRKRIGVSQSDLVSHMKKLSPNNDALSQQSLGVFENTEGSRTGYINEIIRSLEILEKEKFGSVREDSPEYLILNRSSEASEERQKIDALLDQIEKNGNLQLAYDLLQPVDKLSNSNT